MTLPPLLSAAAVRIAAHRMLAEADGLDHWRVDLDRLPAVAARVAAATRAAYPTLAVPPHARWRHFEVGGQDRWAAVAARWGDARTRARAAFDLAIVSVLLDAGSGGAWAFRDAGGTAWRSSEGLGVASFEMMGTGLLSARAGEPWRADAATLAGLGEPAFEAAFQVRDDNPLAGVAGRVALLNRLGEAAAARPDLFAIADDPRPGGLADALAARASGGRIAAADMLALVLEALGPVWPVRQVVDGHPAGDAWPYPRWGAHALVPFHKLSQWLAYSLLEPAEAMGLTVTEPDGLTGLAEYRNGGLLVDLGVIVPRDPAALARVHAVGDPLVVEWRALTVALLDRLHPLVCAALGVTAVAFPLACLLEGGTWATGRAVARERRADGGPPVRIESDGTTF